MGGSIQHDAILAADEAGPAEQAGGVRRVFGMVQLISGPSPMRKPSFDKRPPGEVAVDPTDAPILTSG